MKAIGYGVRRWVSIGVLALCLTAGATGCCESRSETAAAQSGRKSRWANKETAAGVLSAPFVVPAILIHAVVNPEAYSG